MKGVLTYDKFIIVCFLCFGGYGRYLLCRWNRSSVRREGDVGMENFESLISMLDYILDTKRKRHITGGILISMSMLFGGLALTVMTIKNEEIEDE